MRAFVPTRGDCLQRAHRAAHRKHDGQSRSKNESDQQPNHDSQFLRRSCPLDLGLRDQHGDRLRTQLSQIDARNSYQLPVELSLIGQAPEVSDLSGTTSRYAFASSQKPPVLGHAEIGAIVVIEQQDRLCDRRQVKRRLPLLESHQRGDRARGVEQPAVEDAIGQTLRGVSTQCRRGRDDDQQRQHQPQEQIALEPLDASGLAHQRSSGMAINSSTYPKPRNVRIVAPEPVSLRRRRET